MTLKVLHIITPLTILYSVLGAGVALAAAQLGNYAGPGGNDAGADGGLEVNIPGVPGEDYPVLAAVPDTGFTCDGLVEGGYYADPEAVCQLFHVCVQVSEYEVRKQEKLINTFLLETNTN